MRLTRISVLGLILTISIFDVVNTAVMSEMNIFIKNGLNDIQSVFYLRKWIH